MENHFRIKGVLSERWDNLKSRFGYRKNPDLLDDILTFFETNPVNPKEKFGGLLQDVLNKMDEFNKDNNRVIAVVRKIESDKLNPIFRAVTQDLDHKLNVIKKCVYDEDKLYNNSSQNVTNIEPKTNEKEIENVIKKYEEKLKYQDNLYKLLEKSNEDNQKKMSSICKNLNEIKNKYSVEKGTFSKPKIVLEISEKEFLELIKY
ncbi:BfmA/BtgA family mobilization protein [Flavobacterium sp. U410]